MNSFDMSWWMWIVTGLILMVLEIATPGGIFVIFFGVGAIVVGLLELVGLELPLVVQGILFVAVSVASMLMFRKPLLERFNRKMPKAEVDSIAGETAQALEEIPVSGFGKAELRGAAWKAHNIGDAPIAKDARCRVEKVDGLTLHVRG